MPTSRYEPRCTQPDIVQFLIDKIAEASQLPKSAIDPEESVIDLGIDSIIASNINLEVQKTFNAELPFDEMVNGATIQEIAHHIYTSLQPETPPCTEEQTPPASTKTPSIESTSFNEAELNHLPPTTYCIRRLPQYKKVSMQKILFKRAQVDIPYFRSFNSASTDTLVHEGQPLINFASYNYLGFNHDPRVTQAACQAAQDYGTSAASSRIVSGEKTLHQQLETTLAQLYQTESALVFVSGYTTNVSVIGHLMGPNDLILHDSLAHNSIITGAQLSQATRLAFPHNDMDKLEKLLRTHRLNYDRILIVVEGLYSMDGDTAPLPQLIALKQKYKALLMVDEAHSIGVLGQHGQGAREHFNINSEDVDIWMGTLSKSFASCGGYIAGCHELIDYLRYSAPGFVYSVGLAPPLAGASLKAIQLLQEDNHHVTRLQDNSQYFLQRAKERGFNIGFAEGYAIIPIILGHSLNTAKISNLLFQKGVNAQPIIYPGVEENAARLRFFISALHTRAQIDHAISTLEQCIHTVCKGEVE